MGKNGHRNYFMINLRESYVVGLGLEFTTPGFVARPAAERAEETKNCLLSLFIKYTSLRPSETFLVFSSRSNTSILCSIVHQLSMTVLHVQME